MISIGLVSRLGDEPRDTHPAPDAQQKRVTRRSNATGGTSFAVRQLDTLQLTAYAYTKGKPQALLEFDIDRNGSRGGLVHRAFCFGRID
jgi:hypothetical protein